MEEAGGELQAPDEGIAAASGGEAEKVAEEEAEAAPVAAEEAPAAEEPSAEAEKITEEEEAASIAAAEVGPAAEEPTKPRRLPKRKQKQHWWRPRKRAVDKRSVETIGRRRRRSAWTTPLRAE